MYLPEHFKEQSDERIAGLIAAYPLATLISVVAGSAEPLTSSLPLLYRAAEESGHAGLLRGHFARANTHWNTLDGGRATALFHGPNGYVSPTLYTGPGVPTWNYALVKVCGRCRLIEEPDAVWALMTELTERFEDPIRGWRPQQQGERRAKLLAAVVGFELQIDTIEAKFKLSQNRPAADRQAVRASLGPEWQALWPS